MSNEFNQYGNPTDNMLLNEGEVESYNGIPDVPSNKPFEPSGPVYVNEIFHGVGPDGQEIKTAVTLNEREEPKMTPGDNSFVPGGYGAPPNNEDDIKPDVPDNQFGPDPAEAALEKTDTYTVVPGEARQKIALRTDGGSEVVIERTPDRVISDTVVNGMKIFPPPPPDNIDHFDTKGMEGDWFSSTLLPKEGREEPNNDYFERLTRLIELDGEYKALLASFGKTDIKEVLTEAKQLGFYNSVIEEPSVDNFEGPKF